MVTFDGRSGNKKTASGGGAGGSILISTLDLRGYGNIHVNGGRAFDNVYNNNGEFV